MQGFFTTCQPDDVISCVINKLKNDGLEFNYPKSHFSVEFKVE